MKKLLWSAPATFAAPPPPAEYLRKARFPTKIITSAGIAVDKSRLTGHQAYLTATEVAAEHGLDISPHLTRQFTFQDCQQDDLI